MRPPAGSHRPLPLPCAFRPHRDGKSSVSSFRLVSVGQLQILCILSALAPSAFLKDAEVGEAPVALGFNVWRCPCRSPGPGLG